MQWKLSPHDATFLITGDVSSCHLTTTTGVANDDKVGIKMTLCFHCVHVS